MSGGDHDPEQAGVGSTPPGGSRALSVALAVLGFLAGGALLGRAIPPHLPVITSKQEHLEARKDEYSVVFLGTSVMYRHVIPEVFSAELRTLGREERAFNFGAPRMTLAEARLLVDRIAELRSSSIKTVVIDLDLFIGSGKNNHFTSRHVFWHTPVETYFMLSNHFDGGRNWKAATVEIKALAMNVTSIGRISEIFRTTWDPRLSDKEEDDEDVDSEGYRALENERNYGVEKRRSEFLRDRQRFEAEVEERNENPPKPRGIRGYNRRMLERIVERVKEAGLRPVLYEAPAVKAPFRLTGKILPSLPKLSFNDPEAYPDLYLFESRFDQGHLSESGARLLTQHLAREFARRLPGDSPTPADTRR